MPDDNRQRKINVRLTYPQSDEFDYLTKISIIDMDAECKHDIETGNGFIISKPMNTNKKNMKNPDGIYSPRFGQKLGDANPYADRYKCNCGHLTGRINDGIECPVCHTKCHFVDDNFKMFGWIVLHDQYHIIHPKFFDSLDYMFGSSAYNTERKKQKGSKLRNMLNYSPEVDQNGKITPCEFHPDKEPYYGIGMTEFYERFDEILDYYYNLNPKKKDYYDEIKAHRDIVFCHSIPVFTTHLRPASIQDGSMYFEPTNGMYNVINVHVARLNNDKRKMDRNIKKINSELYRIQDKYMELVNEIMNILTGKHGQLRDLMAGRYSFSSRCVIRQDPTLRVDQVKLPYVMLVKCLQQRIINILIRTYNISPSEAFDVYNKALAFKDERICSIINAIIKNATPEGLPVIINRNPTINFGSILQCYCIGFTDTLTMSVSLQSIKSMGADFDGDVLNVFIIINKAFYERARMIFNPRNGMYISHVNGKLNGDLVVQRDTLINANSFIYMGRDKYTPEQLAKISRFKKKQETYFE